MLDLDSDYFQRIEAEALPGAAQLLKELHGFTPLPRTDAIGKLRHGWGRSINERAMSQEAADVELNMQLAWGQQEIRGRVFQLIEVHDELIPRLPALYAIGDIVGPVVLRDWSEFWRHAQLRDWDGLLAEILEANLARTIELDKQKRTKLIKIAMLLHSGLTATTEENEHA